MKITGSFRADDGDMRWTVEIADDRFVTVRRSEDNGNYYIVRNADGSTVSDGTGKTYRSYEYDANEAVWTVSRVAEKY